MEQQSFEYYIDQYTIGQLSREEWATLRALIRDPQHIEELKTIMDRQLAASGKEGYAAITETSLAVLLSAINTESTVQRPVHRIHFFKKWGWAAAAILVIGATIAITMSSDRQPGKSGADLSKKEDILPGSNKAILTLSNGQQVELDSAAAATINDGSLAIQNKNGGLIYAKGSVVVMNTMRTPNGGQYQLTLADGTKVWLNAASSITYPTAFNGVSRQVKITGEAYLEVAKDESKPFMVDVNGQSTIEVLGTSFNVNSYADDAEIKTTLIDGKVKISSASSKSSGIVLKPGQQATIAVAGKAGESSDRQLKAGPDTAIKIINNVNLNQALAWKNGYFSFDKVGIGEMARQIERWYDVDVKFEGTLPVIDFRGEMDRGVKLSGVLRFLADYGVKARLDGRTLIISEK